MDTWDILVEGPVSRLLQLVVPFYFSFNLIGYYLKIPSLLPIQCRNFSSQKSEAMILADLCIFAFSVESDHLKFLALLIYYKQLNTNGIKAGPHPTHSPGLCYSLPFFSLFGSILNPLSPCY